MREYRFDLAAWLRGEDSTSFTGVIYLLKGLPDSSSFMSHWLATLKVRREKLKAEGDPEAQEPDDERTEDEKLFDRYAAEYQVWDGSAKHLAMIVNSIRALSTVWTGKPKGRKKDERVFDIYGPRSWWPEDQLRDEAAEEAKAQGPIKATTAHDFMAQAFGLMGQSPSDAEG